MPSEARVLYVEDDAGLARLVQRGLGRAGFVVEIAQRGEDGLGMLASGGYEAVITDYRLPGMDGLEVIRAIREAHSELPVIMVSGFGDLHLAVEAMKLGADDYVVKDVEGGYLELLPAIVRRQMDGRRLQEEKRRVEEALKQERALSRMAVDSIDQGLCVFDSDLRLRLCNRQFLALNDYPEELGRTGTPLVEYFRHAARRGDYGPDFDDAAVQDKLERASAQLSFAYERKTGHGVFLEVRGRPMPQGGFVVTYTDITERKRAEEEIWRKAHYDGLTGLTNRVLLYELLRRQIQQFRRSGGRFALLFIDLDGFKAVNDTLGHDAGDALLVGVAERLKVAVRESDLVARLGGDEFVVLLLGVHTAKAASQVAQEIIDALGARYELAGCEARVTASVGITLYPRHGETVDDLVNRADRAMYAAKAAGKGRFAVSS